MTNQNETLRRFSTTWPPFFFCASCGAVQVNAPGVLCPTCVNKEAEIVRYDTWHSERRQRRILWAAIVVIGAIVFAVNWFNVGR